MEKIPLSKLKKAQAFIRTELDKFIWMGARDQKLIFLPHNPYGILAQTFVKGPPKGIVKIQITEDSARIFHESGDYLEFIGEL